jgi:hypothetical protein
VSGTASDKIINNNNIGEGGRIMKRFVLILMFIGLPIIFLCCGEDDPVNPGDGANIWPDRTNKEDCINIIKRVYDERKIEKYKELLLKPGVLQEEEFAYGYIWKNQQNDTIECGQTQIYDEDWRGTAGILDSASELQLKLYSCAASQEEDWEKVSEIRGVEGPNFWRTIRNYNFLFNFGNELYVGDYDVIFVIGPDPADSSKYVIYQADDVPKHYGASALNILKREEGFSIYDIFTLRDREDGKRQPASPEQTSWGAVKFRYK